MEINLTHLKLSNIVQWILNKIVLAMKNKTFPV